MEPNRQLLWEGEGGRRLVSRSRRPEPEGGHHGCESGSRVGYGHRTEAEMLEECLCRGHGDPTSKSKHRAHVDGSGFECFLYSIEA